MDHLFTLFYKLSDRSRLKIEALHTRKFDERGCSRITIRATHFIPHQCKGHSGMYGGVSTIYYCGSYVCLRPFRKPIRREIWAPNQTWCSPSPSHTDDGKATRKLVTSLVSERSLDYTEKHSREQKDFAEKYGDELEMLALLRYGED